MRRSAAAARCRRGCSESTRAVGARRIDAKVEAIRLLQLEGGQAGRPLSSSSSRPTPRSGRSFSAKGHGSFQTRNTATRRSTSRCPTAATSGACERSPGRIKQGSWSQAARCEVLAGAAPELVAPEDGRDVQWPVPRWCCSGRRCRARPSTSVVIATDPCRCSPRHRHPGQAGRDFRDGPRPSRGARARALLLGGHAGDAQEHPGARSAVGSFDWTWPTGDHRAPARSPSDDPAVFEPQFCRGIRCSAQPATRSRSTVRRLGSRARRSAAAIRRPARRSRRPSSAVEQPLLLARARLRPAERRRLERRRAGSTRTSTTLSGRRRRPDLHLRDNPPTRPRSGPGPGRPPRPRFRS